MWVPGPSRCCQEDPATNHLPENFKASPHSHNNCNLTKSAPVKAFPNACWELSLQCLHPNILSLIPQVLVSFVPCFRCWVSLEKPLWMWCLDTVTSCSCSQVEQKPEKYSLREIFAEPKLTQWDSIQQTHTVQESNSDDCPAISQMISLTGLQVSGQMLHFFFLLLAEIVEQGGLWHMPMSVARGTPVNSHKEKT